MMTLLFVTHAVSVLVSIYPSIVSGVVSGLTLSVIYYAIRIRTRRHRRRTALPSNLCPRINFSPGEKDRNNPEIIISNVGMTKLRLTTLCHYKLLERGVIGFTSLNTWKIKTQPDFSSDSNNGESFVIALDVEKLDKFRDDPYGLFIQFSDQNGYLFGTQIGINGHQEEEQAVLSRNIKKLKFPFNQNHRSFTEKKLIKYGISIKFG
ncbi:hypothetical protein [Lacticaseibacillus paracasei]|uniref:hypothetical protein n=1 Tax=Lacticaseibacillus paracasei TaxID=1597 RepID=UPI0034E8FA8A